MADDMPDWAKQLQEAAEHAAREIGAAVEKSGFILTAQAAMGWAFQGEFDKARAEIEKLPSNQRDIIAMAARALAQLAEEP
ncbi:hypothetical protein AB0K34_13730 [Actinomadura sp. NPDC049382]|uniref:hypothetical protein n=1 Tax=Actinomadura sp. NPDC049382 TaxID=3158220 RepID=UPI0034268881